MGKPIRTVTPSENLAPVIPAKAANAFTHLFETVWEFGERRTNPAGKSPRPSAAWRLAADREPEIAMAKNSLVTAINTELFRNRPLPARIRLENICEFSNLRDG